MEPSINYWTFYFTVTSVCLIELLTNVNGHGRMFEPPARNTMWRFGFPSFPNYEDSELFCGGIKVIVV